MSDTPTEPTDDAPAPEPKVAEAARARRRLITLAELLALTTVFISALTLWMRWDDRRTDARDRALAVAAEQAKAASAARSSAAVLLEGTPRSGGDLLALKDRQHDVQRITLAFPDVLKVGDKESLVDLDIDAAWISGPLLALTDGGADERHGKLPVLITAEYWSGDRHVRDTAIYDLVWHTDGRILRGRVLKLDGLVLHERGGSRARLNDLWKREAPGGA